MCQGTGELVGQQPKQLFPEECRNANRLLHKVSNTNNLCVCVCMHELKNAESDVVIHSPVDATPNPLWVCSHQTWAYMNIQDNLCYDRLQINERVSFLYRHQQKLISVTKNECAGATSEQTRPDVVSSFLDASNELLLV